MRGAVGGKRWTVEWGPLEAIAADPLRGSTRKLGRVEPVAGMPDGGASIGLVGPLRIFYI